MGDSMKAFEFIKIEDLPPKPRDRAITEIRGSYYVVVTPTYLRELFEIAGDYIDIFKYSGGSMRLHPRETVLRINRLCHDHGIMVSTGGFTERVLIQGAEAFDKYLEEASALEFDIVEISSGYIDIDDEDKAELVRAVRRAGLKPKPEVSLVKGAGGAHEEWETEGMPHDHMIRDIETYLSAGAWMIMIESEGITEGVKKWRTDIVEDLIKRFGISRLMFEAAERPVFRWYIYTSGRDVNLFIDHTQIIELTALRTGLWAPKKPWGRVRYRK
jgi:phosphosulfolactate synthase (CoM biosynthesis protein A)